MLDGLQPWHIIVLVVVLVLLFGAKRLPDASRSIGRSLRIFKAETKGLRGDDHDEPSADANPAAAIAPPAPVAAAAPVVAPVTAHVAAPVAAPATAPVAAPVTAAVAPVPAAHVQAAPVPAAVASVAGTADSSTASPLTNLPFMSQPTAAGRPQN